MYLLQCLPCHFLHTMGGGCSLCQLCYDHGYIEVISNQMVWCDLLNIYMAHTLTK